MECSPPSSSVHGIRQEYWSGLLPPPPGDLPHPGIQPTSLISPALAGWFFITSITREAQFSLVGPNKEVTHWIQSIHLSFHPFYPKCCKCMAIDGKVWKARAKSCCTSPAASGSLCPALVFEHQLHPRRPQSTEPARPGEPRGPAPRAYLVEGGHGCRAHHQGYADDGVAVEAIRVGHHHDPSDGEDGGHDLGGRKTLRSEQRRGIGGAPTCRQGEACLRGCREGGGAPFQSFGDHAKAALLSQCLSLLGRGPSAKPGVTQGPEMVHGKGQRRDSASCRRRPAGGGGHSRNDRFFGHDYGRFTTPS